ncbi:hypothetical protein C5S32_06340 [ANME-1 cluster archaeon GoMg1]|nr:hypothetical protein [ANME-1 cluster archaeon GoMg1]
MRLIGIDAPERDEKCYTEAKEYLKSRILHKEVDLEKDITDTKYQRIIADAEQEAIEKQVGCLWSPEVQSTTISIPALAPAHTPAMPTSVNAKAGEKTNILRKCNIDSSDSSDSTHINCN